MYEHLEQLTELFADAGHAHQDAFIEVDGVDPEWPLWYAAHLITAVRALLHSDITQSRLVCCLLHAEDERTTTAPDAAWPQFYAHFLLERFEHSQTAARDRLALYHFDSCPFCRRVHAVIDELGVAVTRHDILGSREHHEALVAARGRATVPVLRITSPDGSERWMPESADIIAYLRDTYGPERHG